MLDRLAHLTPVVRIAIVAVSAFGLLALGVMLATGATRGDAVPAEDEPPVPLDDADVPPMDRELPERIETATFAMG